MPARLADRIQLLLRKSDQWQLWSNVLAAAHAIGEFRKMHEPHAIYSHVDTSEVIEYVFPKREPPMELKVSLELLFGGKRFPLYLLPTHGEELHTRIRALDQQIRNFLYGKKELNRTVRRMLVSAIDRLRPGPAEEFCAELARLIADKVPPDEALETDRRLSAWRLLRDLFEKRRVRFVNVDALPIRSNYAVDREHFTRCYRMLRDERPDEADLRNQVDAQALDYLQWLKEALPDGHVPILYTRTNAIFNVVERFREGDPECEGDPEYLTKHAIPLVQSPETALVYFGRFGKLTERKHPEAKRLRNHLALARAASAPETKRRLADLRQWHEAQHQVAEDYVSDLEGRFQATADAFDHLAKVALNTMLVNPEHRRSRLYEFVTKPDLGLKPLELLDAFEDLLDERVSEVEASRGRLYLSVFPDAPWDVMEVTSAGNSMLLEPLRPVGKPPTKYVFQSSRVQEALERIMQSSGGPNPALNIREQLFGYEVALKDDPEFYLLLSFVFSMCQDMWFQAYDAADQGLRVLAAPDSHRADVEAAHAIMTCELSLARATAMCRWGLYQHEQPNVSALFMSKAAEALEECLTYRKKWGEAIEEGATGIPVRDYRCLRELSFLYGSASDRRLPLALGKQKPAVEDPAWWRKLRQRALKYAREGFRLAPKGSYCYYYLANNILYGLTVLATRDERHLEERLKYAEILEARNEITEASILDTLRCHYKELAKHELDPRLRQDHEDRAETYRELAGQAKGGADKPTRDLIDRHNRES